jgi:hypothetical protein
MGILGQSVDFHWTDRVVRSCLWHSWLSDRFGPVHSSIIMPTASLSAAPAPGSELSAGPSPVDLRTEILAQLDRQTVLLETIAAALCQSQPAPNYQGNLDRFRSFDWSRIGATIEQEDADGVATVLWRNNLYVRRSAANKFEPAIWFSRPIGKDDEGNNRYERLITFKRQAAVEPLPDRVRQTVVGRSA